MVFDDEQSNFLFFYKQNIQDILVEIRSVSFSILNFVPRLTSSGIRGFAKVEEDK